MTDAILPTLLPVLLRNGIEASLLALAVALLLRAFRPRPAARHLLWLLVLLKLLLPPVAGIPFGLSGACARLEEAARSAAGSLSLAAAVDPAPLLGPDGEAPLLALVDPVDELAGAPEERAGAEPPAEWPILEGTAALSAAAGVAPGAVAPGAALPAEPALPDPAPARARWNPDGAATVAWVWITASLGMALVQLSRVLRFASRIAALPRAGAEVLREASELASALGLRAPPEVRVSSGRLSPFLWALGPPVVILPDGLEDPARRAALRSVLAHELAHLRRGDQRLVWIELAGSILFGWLPTFWWARREMERAADEACDAWAVSALGSRRDYAESILSIVEFLNVPPPAAPIPARGFGGRATLERRLTMIYRDPIAPRLSWSGILGLALAALLVLPAAPGRAVGQQEPSAVGGQDSAGISAPPAPPAPAARPVHPVPPLPEAPRALPLPPAGAPVPIGLPPGTTPPTGTGLILTGPGGGGGTSIELSNDPLAPPEVQPPAGGSGYVRKRTAPARASRELNLSSEERLAKLEKSLEKILSRLDAMQGAGTAQDPSANFSTGGGILYGRPGKATAAAPMAGPSAGFGGAAPAPAPARHRSSKAVLGQNPLNQPGEGTAPSGSIAGAGASSDSSSGGNVYGSSGWEAKGAPDFTYPAPGGGKAGNIGGGTGLSYSNKLPADLSPEKRSQIERLDAEFQRKLRKLETEHRRQIEKLLKAEENEGPTEPATSTPVAK